MPTLLSSANTRLVAFQYQQLLALVQQAIASGDYNGGQLFDQTAALALLAQGQDFISLPVISAESRASADTLTNPLQLLMARYAAITAENTDFLSRMTAYTQALEQDGNQIDRMLLAADLEAWVAALPKVTGAELFYYDLGSTHGVISNDLPLTDPLTGLSFLDAAGQPLQLVPVCFALDNQLAYGMGAAAALTASPPLTLTWTQPVAGLSAAGIGPDWATYSLTTPSPLLDFAAPSVEILLPNNPGVSQVVRLNGTLTSGSLPVYLRFVFLSRNKALSFSPTTAGQVFSLSPYLIDPSIDPVVVNSTQSFEQDQDYRLDFTNSNRNLTALASLVGQSLTVFFNEFYPAYQCSINNVDWSPELFLDPLQPYPDPQAVYFPVARQTGSDGSAWYPLSDELGHPLGLSFQPALTIVQEYLLRIEALGLTYGATAVLEIDLTTPDYFNGVRLTPCTSLPLRLQLLTGEGLGLNSDQILWAGDLLLDRPLTVRFANSDQTNPYISKLFATFYQENYTLTEDVSSSPAELRQATLAQFQYFIPYAASPIYQALPTHSSGAEYEFGLKDIQAERWDPLGNCVFVTGPFSVSGSPSLLRLDAVVNAAIDCYPVLHFYNSIGFQIGAFAAATPISFNGPGSVCLSLRDLAGASWPALPVGSAAVYLKWVFRSPLSILTRYCLQVV
jgi:hypothetical protein